ncbi:MAG: XrtA/PEP-CTERM system histidine kinase PrsK [Pseudomonadota bacterium]
MVAAVSHGFGAAAFTCLLVLLLTRWRGRRHAVPLALACALTALWALACAEAAAAGGMATPRSADMFEALRTAAWLVLLLCLLGYGGTRLAGWLCAIGAAVLLQLASIALRAGTRGALPLPAPAAWAAQALIAGRLILAMLGLLLLEQLYRGTPSYQRWSVKFACLGIGGLFAYDFYLYSDALLFRHVNDDIRAARGLVDALTVPLLAISAARNPGWAPGLALSRRVTVGSAALAGCALYLLAMAGSAWYLRSIGGAWGPLMQLACLFGSVFVLGGVLFSGTVRAYVKVFINKHFYQARFDYREEWLRFTRALSEQGPDLGQRSVQALAALVESPAGALWIRRERDLCELAASWNMALPRAPAASADSLCQFMERRRWVLDVPDCLAQPRLYEGLALPDCLNGVPQLWLLVPLLLHGRLFGFIALARPRTPLALDWEVRDLLKIAGSQAAGYLAHRESTDALAVARQFESLNRMSSFIVHDLKNLVAQLSLLQDNAERHRGDPDFQQDMLDTLAHSVRKMTLLLKKLCRSDQPERHTPLPLAQVLQQAVQARAAARPKPVLDICDDRLEVVADWTRLERVLGHLIQNAIEATPPDGRVTLRLRRAGAAALVELSDTGAGMTEEFIRQRLFKPFDSTKPAGMGIGVFESREYIRDLGGQLDVASVPGAGSTFRVTLPLHVAAAALA